MENETFKKQIEWLERLGIRCDITFDSDWKLYTIDMYRKGVKITTATLTNESEVATFLRGYIYATIDYQHALIFM